MINHSRRNVLLGAGMGLAATLAAKGESGGGKSSTEKPDAAAFPPSNPRDLPAKDRRLEIRTLDTPRTPPSFKSREQWEARAARLREQVLAAPSALLLHNLGDKFSGEAFSNAYSLQGASDRLRIASDEVPAAEIATWLMKS